MSTRSASTPRLRFTAAYYGLLVVATAVAGRSALSPMLDTALGIVALLLVSLAALGRIWTSLFIAGRKDTELVTNGPYALCRHPLYLLSWVGGLGIGIATRSVALTLLTLAVLTVLHARAVAAEERLLAQRHGATFADYCSRVSRWWPRMTRTAVPETVPVPPAILWKAFVDAGAFLLLYALVEAAHALRTSGILPSLVTLP